MSQDDIEKLKKEIDEAKDFKEKTLTRLRLAEAYQQEGDQKKAIEIYEELLKMENPPFQRTKVLLALGDIYDSLEQYEEALKWYKEVLADNEADQDRLSVAEAAISTGEIIYHLLGNIDEGLKYFKVAEARMGSSENSLDKQTQSRLLGRLGVAYYDKQAYSTAIDYLTRSIEIDMQLGRKEDSLYSSHEVIGWCYYYLNDYKKAIESFEKIVKEFKQYKHISEVFRLLGHSYWNIRDYRRAIKYLELALQADSQNEDISQVEYYLGTSYHYLRIYDQAKLHLQRFLEMGPDNQEQIQHAKAILSGKG